MAPRLMATIKTVVKMEAKIIFMEIEFARRHTQKDNASKRMHVLRLSAFSRRSQQ